MKQDWRQILTFFLAMLLLMMGWNMYRAWQLEKQQPQDQPQAQAPADAPDQAARTTPADRTATLEPAPTADLRVRTVDELPETVSLGSRDPFSGYKALVTLDPASAAIDNALLSEHKWRVDDEQTGYPVLNSGLTLRDNRAWPLQLGRLKLTSRAESLPLAANCWTLTDHTVTDEAQSATYHATVITADDQPAIRIEKTYTVRTGVYELDFDVRVTNESGRSLEIEYIELTGPLGILQEDPRSDRRRSAVAAFWQTNAEQETSEFNVERVNVSAKEPTNAFEASPAADLRWFGVSNKFFAAVLRPRPLEDLPADVNYLEDSSLTAQAYRVVPATEPDDSHITPGVTARLLAPEPLAPGQNRTYAFALYLGPIDRNIFNQQPYAALNYNKLYGSGACCTFCAFDWLTLLLLQLMGLVYAVVHNYGIAIMLLVALVRLALHPITKKSQIHMMKMGKLGPQMQELKDKYGDNKQEFQRKQFEVMKEHGLTGGMLWGCLPMLLQFPIWIALYTAVDANVDIRHQGLLPASWHWLTDLSAPDRLIPFSAFGIDHALSIPLLGSLTGPIDAINLLPILLGIGMFLQSKLMAQPGAATNPQAAQQQKMMQIMMPAMMLLFFYNAPSGLNLYIMASTFVGLIESRIVRKHIKEHEALAAESKVATTTKLSGRLGKKKKPKDRPPRRYM